MLASTTSSQQPFKQFQPSTSLHATTASTTLHRSGIARPQPWQAPAAVLPSPFQQQHKQQQQSLQQLGQQQGAQRTQQQFAQHAQQRRAQQQLAQQQLAQQQLTHAQQQGAQHAQQHSAQHAQQQAMQAQHSGLQQLRRVHSATPPPPPSLLRSTLPLASAWSLPPPLVVAVPPAQSAAPAVATAAPLIPQGDSSQLQAFWLQQTSSPAVAANSATLSSSIPLNAATHAGSALAWSTLSTPQKHSSNQAQQDDPVNNSHHANLAPAWPVMPDGLADEAHNHGQGMMQIDTPDHGLGGLDLPDISMENLGTIDFDPSDCLF